MMIVDNSESNTISVDGIDVYFGEIGESNHQALILIHGLGDCARSWDYFAQAMSDEFRVITLDSRGHRSEEHTSELQSLVNLVCRLLLEKKKIRRALVGTSVTHCSLMPSCS